MARGTPHFAKYFDERETHLTQQHSFVTGAIVPRDSYTAQPRPLSTTEEDDATGQLDHNDRLQRDSQARPCRGRDLSPRPIRHLLTDTMIAGRGPRVDVRRIANVQDPHAESDRPLRLKAPDVEARRGRQTAGSNASRWAAGQNDAL